MAAIKPKPQKGQAKEKSDKDNIEKNPFLHIENKHDFQIETNNLLEDPTALVYKGYEDFDLTKDADHFKTELLNYDSEIIIIMRYYEYLCSAKFKFCYVLPTLESGLIMKDVFNMVKHCLKNRLLLNVPSFETVFEPDIQYIGKIKYF
jgi:hypothetical protein